MLSLQSIKIMNVLFGRSLEKFGPSEAYRDMSPARLAIANSMKRSFSQMIMVSAVRGLNTVSLLRAIFYNPWQKLWKDVYPAFLTV